jgi:hypothetical protein
MHRLVLPCTLSRILLHSQLLYPRFGDDRWEAACQRALRFDDPAYQTIKRILTEGLDAVVLNEPSPPLSTARAFVRSVADLVGSALGGVSWN